MISVYLTQWLTLMAVFSLAVLSPGPDFVVAVRNSVLYSRRIGVFTALGFGCGVLVHVAYTLLGLAAIIAQSIVVFNLIKYAGAVYLIYMGVKALRSPGMQESAVAVSADQTQNEKKMTAIPALRSGFLTNLLNPKASLFFLAIFSQIVRADTPMVWRTLYGATCVAMVILWFCLVAFVLNHKHIRGRFLRMTKWIDRVCGSLMIALGLKVAFTPR